MTTMVEPWTEVRESPDWPDELATELLDALLLRPAAKTLTRESAAETWVRRGLNVSLTIFVGAVTVAGVAAWLALPEVAYGGALVAAGAASIAITALRLRSDVKTPSA